MPKCSFLVCDRPEKAAGFCHAHYEQNRRYNRPLTPLRKRSKSGQIPICFETGCERTSKAHGVCDYHYRKPFRVYNEPQARAANLKNNFGITVEEYDRLAAAQNYVCAICKNPCVSGRRLAVDHDHDTDVVRGLLCSKCNTAIGLLDEDPAKFTAAVQYLQVKKAAAA